MTRRCLPARARGFALVLTLVLLALAAVLLAQVARRSLRAVSRADQAQAELQHQWAVRSSQRCLLPQAERVLSGEVSPPEAPDPADAHPAQVHWPLTLGGQTITLVFTDEQAKCNLNALLKRRGREASRSVLRRLPGGQGLQLQPLGEFERKLNKVHPSVPALASYEQLVPELEPAQLPALAQAVTLWGEGQVNARRAGEPVLAAVLAPELGPGQVRRLIRLRDQAPEDEGEGELASWLDPLELSEPVRQRVAARLTDQSTCHGLWTIVHGRQRTWRHLAIASESRSSTVRLSW